MRRVVVALALILLSAVGVGLAVRGVATERSKPSSAPRRSSSALYEDVSVDPSGRPYDVALPPHGSGAATVVRRPLAVLHAPSRQILVLGGEAVPYVRAGEYRAIDLARRPGDRYPVLGVWVVERSHRYDALVGVVVHERDTPVVRWQQLDRVAYVTDGGVGGITTVEWANRTKTLDNEASRLYERELVDRGRQFFRADVDETEGFDTVVFSNGFGDGGFPAVAGYDAEGRRAAIALWSMVAPWRLAFPKGKPPTQVRQREKALAACLAGRRTIDGGHHCRSLQ